MDSVLTGESGMIHHLKVSALFVDGNDEPVDIGDELVALRLPQAIGALLQQLHQHLLNTHTDGWMSSLGTLLLAFICSQGYSELKLT